MRRSHFSIWIGGLLSAAAIWLATESDELQSGESAREVVAESATAHAELKTEPKLVARVQASIVPAANAGVAAPLREAERALLHDDETVEHL